MITAPSTQEAPPDQWPEQVWIDGLAQTRVLRPTTHTGRYTVCILCLSSSPYHGRGCSAERCPVCHRVRRGNQAEVGCQHCWDDTPPADTLAGLRAEVLVTLEAWMRAADAAQVAFGACEGVPLEAGLLDAEGAYHAYMQQAEARRLAGDARDAAQQRLRLALRRQEGR